jgi:endonuclease G, mitochondrial
MRRWIIPFAALCSTGNWKVCVLVREDGSPSATAFLVKQEEIKDLSGFEEMFEVAATRIKISDHQLRRAGETQPL